MHLSKHLINSASILLLILAISTPSYTQVIYTSDIILDESLFNQTEPASCNYRDLKIEFKKLKFTLSYGGGCGEVDFYMVTDGKPKVDKNGIKYIHLRFGFIDEDPCYAMRYKCLEYRLSSIPKIGYVRYIKLDDFDELIEIRY